MNWRSLTEKWRSRPKEFAFRLYVLAPIRIRIKRKDQTIKPTLPSLIVVSFLDWIATSIAVQSPHRAILWSFRHPPIGMDIKIKCAWIINFIRPISKRNWFVGTKSKTPLENSSKNCTIFFFSRLVARWCWFIRLFVLRGWNRQLRMNLSVFYRTRFICSQ